MTVNTQVARDGPYIGNGVTTTFDRNFLVLNDAHLKVFQTVNGVRSEVTTGITKNGVGNATGTVVFDTPPALGVQIVLLREVTLEQQTDLSTQGKVQPVQVEADLDYIMLALQDAKERRDRTPLLPVDTSETDIELPVPQGGRVLVGRDDAGGWENGDAFADFAAAADAAAASAVLAANSEAAAAAAAAATSGDVTAADAARVAAEAAQAAAEAALAEIQNIIGSGDFNFTSFTYDDVSGDIDVDFTLSVATDVVFYLSSSAVPPSSAQMDDGSGALEYFTETLGTGIGSFTETVTTGLSLPLYLYARVTGGVTIRSASILPAVGTFTTQPTIGSGNQSDTITLSEGVFSAAATITIEEFTLDAVDKSGDLSGLDWDTTPETAYGVDGVIRWQVKATDAFGREVLSNVITGTLRDVPDRFVSANWTATANGSGGITVAIVTLPDNGNSAILDLEYRVEGGAWTTSGGTGGFTISGLSDGDKTVEIRAVNGVGDGAGSDTKIVTISGQQTNIVINSIGPQASDGEVPVNYSVVSNDSGVETVIFASTDPDPVAADFNTGATTGYIDMGQVALTTAGADILLAIPDGLLGVYKVALLPTGGGDADVVVTQAFNLDTTDTVISPSAAVPGSGAGEVDVTFTPDEAGTYRVSLFADGAAPSDAAIRDGTGAVATATGSGIAATQTAETLTGVASTAYDVHIYYIDGFGNEVFTAAIDVTSGGGAGAGYNDSFASYANGADLSVQTGYSAGANDGGTANLVADGAGNVQSDVAAATSAVASVTHSADPGSDNTFLELDFTNNSLPSLNVTRLRVWIGDIEYRVAMTGAIVQRQADAGISGGNGSYTPDGNLRTARFEYEQSTGRISVDIDGTEVAVATGLTLSVDRSFEWGVEIGDADEAADITVHRAQAGAL